ncbi:MAG: hypothetical protein AAB588_04570 [Patescibacteria group bacterium]
MHQQHRHYWQHIPYIGIVLFVLGLIGGIALRVTIFLEPIGKFWVTTAWFIGVIAYTLFYFVRISIENHRREICEIGLLKRLETNTLLPEDVPVLYETVSSHCRSKVKYNYIVWLVISIISLFIGIFLR